MSENKEMGGNSRRDFLKLGATGALAFTAGSLFSGCTTKVPEGKVRLLSPDGELVEVDASELNYVPVSNKEAREGIPGRKFVMVIDLARCKNARKCVIACQNMHYLPEDKEWLKVKLLKDNQNTAPYWFPKTCFHCDNPPCVKVCPIDATYKRTDGIVLIDNDRCIGCKFCMAACPYSTRVFNWGEPEIPAEPVPLDCAAETGTPAQIGTVEKCDFCPDMARQGKLPHCVPACPNGAIYYGDQNEDIVTNGSETVRFSQLIYDKGGYRYAEELGTEPRVYYLPPTDRIFPVERGLEDLDEEIKERYKDVTF